MRLIARMLFLGVFMSSMARAETVADGLTMTQLTKDGRSHALQWAWHGDKVLAWRFVSSGQYQLFIMNSDGTDVVSVGEIAAPLFADWSWRSDRLSYTTSINESGDSVGGAFVYDLASKKTIAVSPPYPRDFFDDEEGPLWSPDDKYVVYRLEVGPASMRQVWIADTRSGKSEQILPGRSQARTPAWSTTMPPRLVLKLESSDGNYDIATTDLKGSDVVRITNLEGLEAGDIDDAWWSPAGDWFAFPCNIDMTLDERERYKNDCWIARPDGSDVRNLTKASTQILEDQLGFYKLVWSWDGRYILASGERVDRLQKEVPAMFLIDAVNGGYKIIRTSDPAVTGIREHCHAYKWSYDSSKILFLYHLDTVRAWESDDYTNENRHWYLELYDVATGRNDLLLKYSEALDQKALPGQSDRDDYEGLSWSPDSRSILLSIDTILSADDDTKRTDIFRLDLPEHLIPANAALYDGPPLGRDGAVAPPAVDVAASPAVSAEAVVVAKTFADGVTAVVRPQHMTIAEVNDTLPGYSQYLTQNVARNMFIFKGPAAMLKEFKSDLALVDTPAPLILVDLLAVELTDDANRSLGLDWTYTNGRFGFFQPAGGAIRDLIPEGQIPGLDTFPGVGQSFYQGVGRMAPEFFVRLNSLVKDGEGTILANPRTVATSGKQSKIQILKTLNYFFNEGFDTSGRPVVKKSSINSDTIGEITPTLLPNKQIHLVIDVNVGTFTFSQGAGLPVQTSRKATTEVTVKEGQSIVIGGLRQQEVNRSKTKIPILGSIPLIKPLFTKFETNVQNSVLTIFITPQVLAPNGAPPAWPQLNSNEHNIVPIMEDTDRSKRRKKSFRTVPGNIPRQKIKRKGWRRILGSREAGVVGPVITAQ